MPLPAFSLVVGLGAVWAVDLGPGGLAVGHGAVWAGRGDEKVLRIEP